MYQFSLSCFTDHVEMGIIISMGAIIVLKFPLSGCRQIILYILTQGYFCIILGSLLIFFFKFFKWVLLLLKEQEDNEAEIKFVVCYSSLSTKLYYGVF